MGDDIQQEIEDFYDWLNELESLNERLLQSIKKRDEKGIIKATGCGERRPALHKHILGCIYGELVMLIREASKEITRKLNVLYGDKLKEGLFEQSRLRAFDLISQEFVLSGTLISNVVIMLQKKEGYSEEHYIFVKDGCMTEYGWGEIAKSAKLIHQQISSLRVGMIEFVRDAKL